MLLGKKLGKKILACVLCGIMVFGMAACGNNNGDTEKKNTEESKVSESQKESEKESESESDSDKVTEQKLQLSLNVLFNDSELGYYGNETGAVIEVTEDGQYTLTFDCAKDLSEDGKTAGVTGLNNLTAIYIKDYAVTTGELTQSNLKTCNIRWDKVVVDGQELTITNSEAKSGIKSSNIFDTNDPLNAWDGSAVEEVTTDTTNHVLNINLENPQTITVTFTLSELEFAQ